MRIFTLIFLTLILSSCNKNARKMPKVCCEPVVCAQPHYEKAAKKSCHKKKRNPCRKKRVHKPKCAA